MPVLEMKNIYKSFGSVEAVHDVSLSVDEGEVVAVIGPSGSGKSTLLRCVNHLETIDKGSIAIDGEYIVQNNETGIAAYKSDRIIRNVILKTGMVFQQFNLFPHMTALENVTCAPIITFKQSKHEAAEQAKILLSLVGLEDRMNNYPSQLSGGQKQRVAIARALMLNPNLLLFDEPTSALDPEITGEVLSVIRNLAEKKITMLVVTHEMSFARDVASRIIFMDGGRVVAEGLPEEIFINNKNERLSLFLSALQNG